MNLSFLLRPLLPTWRFFEDVGSVATLYYRSGLDPENLSSWVVYPEYSQGRHLGSLFFNSEGNLRLAERAVIEGFLHDIAQELGEHQTKVTETVSYQLVRNLVRFAAPKKSHFQFKLRLNSNDVFISSTHEPSERTAG